MNTAIIIALDEIQGYLTQLNQTKECTIDTHAMMDMLIDLYLQQPATKIEHAVNYMMKHDMFPIDLDADLLMTIHRLCKCVRDRIQQIQGITNAQSTGLSDIATIYRKSDFVFFI